MSKVDEDAVISDTDWLDETNHDEVGERDKVQVIHLTQETISQGLSLLCKTGNGLGHAFIKLDIKEKGLNDISAISRFIHVRILDLSKNKLTDLSPLASLTELLWLKVDNNAVTSFKGQPFAELTYLQWLSMSANQLTVLDGLVGPALESLNLTGNSIGTLEGLQSNCLSNLVTLELRGNHLNTTDGINLPNLQRLYLAQNVIERLEGLEKLERLTTLHLRDNRLESLDGLSPNMKCLQYLNLRGNSLSDENALQQLGLVSNSLRVLVLSENPLLEKRDFLVLLRVLTLVPHLERMDKNNVSPEERAEAKRRFKVLKEGEIPDP